MTKISRRSFFRNTAAVVATGSAALAMAQASDNKSEKACVLCPGNNTVDTHKVLCSDCDQRMWLCESHERGTYCKNCESLRMLGITPPSEVHGALRISPQRSMLS